MDCEYIGEFDYDTETLKSINEKTKKYENASSEEEIAEIQLDEAEQLREDGFLPQNEDYYGTMTSPMVEVENAPKVYVIEECIPACQILWGKNIYTFMTSDYNDKGMCWIEIKNENLSPANKRIYEQMEGQDVIKFEKHKGAVCFGVNKVGRAGQRRLKELAEKFVMQDVPRGEAYKQIDDFLIDNCNCYDEIPNPIYKYMEPLDKVNIEELNEYVKEYDKWLKSKESKKTIKTLNTRKLDKELSEYLKKYDFILEDKKVFLGGYHYKKHLNYIKSI